MIMGNWFPLYYALKLHNWEGEPEQATCNLCSLAAVYTMTCMHNVHET